MAMSKEGDFSYYLGSQEYYEYFCQPCDRKGKSREAEGYCENCCEFLCLECYRIHKRPTALEHHVLLDKTNMKKHKPLTRAKDVITDRCLQHKDKLEEYFCTVHKKMACHACVTLKHRKCDPVQFIPEVATDIRDSQEYKELNQKLDTMIAKSQEITKKSLQNTSSTDTINSTALQDMKLFRTEINTVLDNMEKYMMKEAEEKKEEDKKKMKSFLDKSSQKTEELRRFQSEIRHLQNVQNNCQLFVTMKKAQDNLEAIQATLQDLDTDNNVSQYRFIPNRQSLEVLKKPGGLGTISSPPLKATFVTDINVKSSSDKKDCNITGAALVGDKMVFCDHDNCKVKLIDTEEMALKRHSDLKVSSKPWTVTEVNYNKVAVTLPKARKIAFLKLTNKLKLKKEMRVNGECHGIAYRNGMLVITFINPGKFEVLDMQGNALHKIDRDSQGRQLFGAPEYVAVGADHQSLYISDKGNNTVTSITVDGIVKGVYKDSGLMCPRQLTVDIDGNLFVSGCGSHNIIVLNSQCQKLQVLLNESEGLCCYQSLCYSQASGMLYVGMADDNMKIVDITKAKIL